MRPGKSDDFRALSRKSRAFEAAKATPAATTAMGIGDVSETMDALHLKLLRLEQGIAAFLVDLKDRTARLDALEKCFEQRLNALYVDAESRAGSAPNAQQDWRDVVSHICTDHEVTLPQVQSPGRTAMLCMARGSIIVALAERGWSTPRIGQFLNRDHSTIVYALKRARKTGGQ